MIKLTLFFLFLVLLLNGCAEKDNIRTEEVESDYAGSTDSQITGNVGFFDSISNFFKGLIGLETVGKNARTCPLHCAMDTSKKQCVIDIGYYGNKYLKASASEKEKIKQEIRSKNCLK